MEADGATRDARKDDPAWLAGLPIAVKDLSDVAGVRTTYASPIFADHVPETSDLMVERLEANGAIVIAKSNTPEFGAGGNTFNALFPPTVTPWDTTRTSGGSSGGSAAALATGEVWLATGSDYGGSLRTPAAFCGVVGLRPSPGRVASGPSPTPFDPVPIHGPMARNVGDLALMLDAMAGEDPADPLSLPAPGTPFQPQGALPRRPRVAYSVDLGGITPVDPEVARLTDRAVERLAKAGWDVTEEVPDFSGAMDAFYRIRALSFAATKGPLMEKHRDLLKEDIIWNTETGLAQTGADLAKGEIERGRLFQAMRTFFETHDLILAPTACLPPFPVDVISPREVAGHTFPDYMGWLTLPSVLSLTSCPVLSLPIGITEGGLPVGMQMCGRYRGEHALLAAALEAEAVMEMSGHVPLDPRTP